MIHVVGATGRSGVALCQALVAAGEPFVPVVRNPAKWAAPDSPGTLHVADLRDAGATRTALQGASQVAACVHARWTPAILAATTASTTLVLMGSTRRFSRWPDEHGNGVRAGEAAFLASGRPGVMLHPTMIYGASGENNLRRLVALLQRLPIAPLPAGGRALVQPIHQNDVTQCLLAALRHPWTRPETLIIAGPEPMPYQDFVRAVAEGAGLHPPPVLRIPATLLMLLAPLTHLIPGMPTIGIDEIQRLTEDKAFDIGPMRATLGVQPVPLTQGLTRTFAGPALRHID